MSKTKTNIQMVEIIALRKANRLLIDENEKLRSLVSKMEKQITAGIANVKEYEA